MEELPAGTPAELPIGSNPAETSRGVQSGIVWLTPLSNGQRARTAWKSSWQRLETGPAMVSVSHRTRPWRHDGFIHAFTGSPGWSHSRGGLLLLQCYGCLLKTKFWNKWWTRTGS